MKRLPMVLRVLINLLMVTAWSYGVFLAYEISVVQREEPNTLISQKPLNDHVNPGGTLQIEMTVMRHRYCTQTVTQFIIDAKNTRFDLPEVITPNDAKLGLNVFNRSIEMPEEISPGPATFSQSTSFRCHWSHLFWPLRRPLAKMQFIVDPQQ
jgi:hypothetical protein